ncbi:MAG: hypothetical protein LBH06_07105 [Rikenellaceae bacterium]|jgi:hypothetical protein|nr:hypothetical protein [Rikenellaceae bacterium]
MAKDEKIRFKDKSKIICTMAQLEADFIAKTSFFGYSAHLWNICYTRITTAIFEEARRRNFYGLDIKTVIRYMLEVYEGDYEAREDNSLSNNIFRHMLQGFAGQPRK